MKGLPNTLHELLSLALNDMEKCQKDKKYRVNMALWHSPDQDDLGEVCNVCLAGAVMAKTLEENPFSKKWPNLYSKTIQKKLEAIDHMRTFCFQKAFTRITNPKHRLPKKYETLSKLETKLNKLDNNTYITMVTMPYFYYKQWRKVASELKKANI